MEDSDAVHLRVPDAALGKMTLQFVKVRYGKYEAREDDVRNMEAWQQSLQSIGEKGGADE